MKIGDYIIGAIIIETKNEYIYLSFATVEKPNGFKSLKGYVEGVYEKDGEKFIQINGEWYRIYNSQNENKMIGTVVIDSVIPKEK